MNPLTFLLGNWRYILIGVLAASTALFFNLWQAKKEEHAAHLAVDQALYEKAKAEKEAIEANHNQTLEDVSNAWNNQLPAVRQAAVAAYCRRYGCGVLQPACSANPVSGNAPGAQGAHGASGQQMDGRFIEDCAQDALKVELWREWARKNNLKVD